jgi:hypothetical protein
LLKMSRRWVGIAAIVLGFVVTVIAGFVLAASQLTTGALFVRALIVFALVLPILLVGIYLYVTSNTESSDLSETELQLKLMDLIHERKRVSLQELAAELKVSMGTVARLVEDLDSLDIFMGYIDWGNQVIYAVRPETLPDTNP